MGITCDFREGPSYHRHGTRVNPSADTCKWIGSDCDQTELLVMPMNVRFNHPKRTRPRLKSFAWDN